MPNACLCLRLAAAASFAIAAPVAAKPVKHSEPVAARSPKPLAPIVLASADALPSHRAKPAQTADAPKPVTPRVTTCRCGDPDAGDAATDDQ